MFGGVSSSSRLRNLQSPAIPHLRIFSCLDFAAQIYKLIFNPSHLRTHDFASGLDGNIHDFKMSEIPAIAPEEFLRRILE